MDLPKFKAKAFDTGEWVYGSGVTDHICVYSRSESKNRVWVWGGSCEWVEIDPATLCQLTGNIHDEASE